MRVVVDLWPLGLWLIDCDFGCLCCGCGACVYGLLCLLVYCLCCILLAFVLWVVALCGFGLLLVVLVVVDWFWVWVWWYAVPGLCLVIVLLFSAL